MPHMSPYWLYDKQTYAQFFCNICSYTKHKFLGKVTGRLYYKYCIN